MSTREKLDPRVKRTRKLLMNAHNDLVHEIGMSKLSIQKITERATVNRTTFYAHFKNLEDLTRYAVSQMFLASLDKALLNAAPITAKRFVQLGLATHQHMQFFGTDEPCPNTCGDTKLTAEDAKDDDLRLRVEKQIERELYTILLSWLTVTTAKTNSRFVEPKLQALALSSALCNLASQQANALPELSIDEAMRQLWSFFQS